MGGGGVNTFYWRQIVALDYVVDNTQNLVSSHGGFLINASSQRNNLIKLTHYDETKKRAHDSRIVRAKETLKLSYIWPRQRQASSTSQRIKALRQGRHWILSLTHQSRFWCRVTVIVLWLFLKDLVCDYGISWSYSLSSFRSCATEVLH